MAEISNTYLEIYAELPLRAGVVHIMAMARELLAARARITELQQVTQHATERAVAAESKLDEERAEYAGWRPPARVIDSVDELEWLEAGAIIRDAEGDVFRHLGEWRPGFTHEWDLLGGYDDRSRTAEIALPVTTLWQPEVNGNA